MPEDENAEQSDRRRGFPWSRLAWVFVLVPPLLTWFLIEEYRFKLPQSDDLSFIQFYQNTVDEGIDWKEATSYHNEHRVVFNRLFYAGMFNIFGGDVRNFAVVTFLIALAIGACLLVLGRPVFHRYSKWSWLIALFAMAALFTAAQGYAWQWGFIYANHLPWLSVALGMTLLVFEKVPRWIAFFFAGLLAAAATLSFGMGLLAWLLLPLFAFLGNHFRSTKQALAVLLPWTVIGIACSAYALSGMGGKIAPADAPADAELTGLRMVLADPIHAAWFCFSLLGNQLGQGTAFEFKHLAPAAGIVIFGIIALGWVAVLVGWKDHAFRSTCAPWLTLGSGAILATGLIASGRLSGSGILAQTPHYLLTTCYGAISAVFLLPLLVNGLPRLRSVLLPVFAGVFSTLHIINWKHGEQLMKWWHTDNFQLIAAARFIDVLKPEQLPNLNRFGDVTALYRRMRDDGQLDWVDFLPADDLGLEQLRVLSPLSTQWAKITRNKDEEVVEGYAYIKGGSRPADAVVFTWREMDADESERIIFDVVFPVPPADYFRRSWQRKEEREHYAGFSHELVVNDLPKKRLQIEAHAMNL
ncbi:MAG: hypothetical protein AAGH89_18800, partial [Verrucomicrobiota bacterium]